MLGQFASIAALNLRNAVLLQHVQDLAERDSLTGAANRRMFQLALERTCTGADESQSGPVTAVLFLDLDDFKVVNDTLGHAAGDALLVAVTERISGLVRGGDLVARLGGDEFAVLTEDDPSCSRSRSMAGRLVYELRAPYVIGDKHVVGDGLGRHRQCPGRGVRRGRPASATPTSRCTWPRPTASPGSRSSTPACTRRCASATS